MARVRWLFGIGLAATLSSSQALGQGFGHHPQGGGGAQPQINCDAIAANPNAGMDKASCEAMLNAQQTYENARNDPSAARPGDEAMTCDDIKAEFMQQPFRRPSQEHVAAAQTATSDYMKKSGELQAEATAAMAGVSAEAMAASAVSAVNPVAGRAADAAVAAHQQAAQATLNAKARTELTPRYRAVMSSESALVTDASSQLADNPRMARLVSLANEKHCHGW
jgi:hypothetical protein